MKLLAYVVLLGTSIFRISALPNPSPSPEPTPTTEQTLSIELVKKAAKDIGIPGDVLEKRASGTVSASVPINSLDRWEDKYVIPVKVGAQSFDVVLDTGSHKFWVLGSKLPKSSIGSSQSTYSPGSTAATVPSVTWAETYSGETTAAAAGEAFIDNVVIGSATATSMTFGVATSVSEVKEDQRSGIIGLGWGSAQNGYKIGDQTLPQQPATFTNKTMDNFPGRVFTLDMRWSGTGTLNLGFIDNTKFSGTPSYVNRIQTTATNWFITPGAYYVNGTNKGTVPVSFYHPDSGAPFMSFPKQVVDDYYKTVPNTTTTPDEGPAFPCSNIQNGIMPSFSIDLGGTIFTVPPQYMWYQKYNSKLCTGILREGGMNRSNGQVGAILGDMFLRTVFAIYKYEGNGSVGFATKNLAKRLP